MNSSDIKYRKMWNVFDKYDLEILDYISRDLICFLCAKVIKNAYQNICGCKYCYKCIVNYFRFEFECPGKSEECHSQIITHTSVQIDHALNKRISKLLVKCPFDDCTFSSELIDIENHIDDHEMDSTDLFDIRRDSSLINSFRLVESKLMELKDKSDQFESLLTQMEHRMAQLLCSESNNNNSNSNNNLMSTTNAINRNSIVFRNSPNKNEKCLKNLIQTVANIKLNLTHQSKEMIERTNQATSNTINNEIENKNLEKKVDICHTEQSVKKFIIANENQEENNIDDMFEDFHNGESSRTLVDDIVVVNKVNVERKQTGKFPEADNIECVVILKKDKDLRIKCSSKNRKVKLKKSNNLVSSFFVQEQPERRINICNLDLNIKNISPFLWKIDNFYKQFSSARLNKVTNIESDKFYSHFGGYRLALKIFPNGYKTGQGTHLSIFFYLLKGENDEYLEWPMKHCVSISLMNQTTNEIYLDKKVNFENCHTSDVFGFSKPLTASNKMVGETYFIPLKTLLYDNRLLKNDSLVFLCTVN